MVVIKQSMRDLQQEQRCSRFKAQANSSNDSPHWLLCDAMCFSRLSSAVVEPLSLQSLETAAKGISGRWAVIKQCTKLA